MVGVLGDVNLTCDCVVNFLRLRFYFLTSESGAVDRNCGISGVFIWFWLCEFLEGLRNSTGIAVVRLASFFQYTLLKVVNFEDFFSKMLQFGC